MPARPSDCRCGPHTYTRPAGNDAPAPCWGGVPDRAGPRSRRAPFSTPPRWCRSRCRPACGSSCRRPGPRRPVPRGDLVALPVFVRRPLAQQQRVDAVCFRRRLPQRVLVRAEADEEHAHALLRHAVVGRVHQLERAAVLACGARFVLPFAQASQLVAPLLLRLGPPAKETPAAAGCSRSSRRRRRASGPARSRRRARADAPRARRAPPAETCRARPRSRRVCRPWKRAGRAGHVAGNADMLNVANIPLRLADCVNSKSPSCPYDMIDIQCSLIVALRHGCYSIWMDPPLCKA